MQWKLQQVRPSSGTDVYPHMPILYVHTPRDFTKGASLVWRLRRRISTVLFTSRWSWPGRWPIRPILGFWVSKVHKNVRFPALDADQPRRAKFDTASFILGGEIRNRTNTQKTNRNRYIHILPIVKCG